MSKLRNKTYVLAPILFATPLIAFAQIKDFDSILTFVSMGLDRILPILVLIALFVFVYSVAIFAWKSRGGAEASAEKNRIIWSIIGLFVILSIWGIIGVVSRTLGTGTGGVFEDVSAN